MLAAHSKSPVPAVRPSVKKAEAARIKPPTVIVFEISAMDRPTIDEVKTAIEQRARQMIQTVDVPCEFDKLSQHGRDELKSLKCSDVTVDIGKSAALLFAIVFVPLPLIRIDRGIMFF